MHSSHGGDYGGECRALIGMALLAFLTSLGIAGAQGQDSGPFISQSQDGSNWRARGECLLWWTKGNRLPALVTTSPEGTPRPEAGLLPGAAVLFGDNPIDDRMRTGGRLTLSRWLDANETWALEGVFLYLGDDSQTGHFVAESSGLPILGRPFFNALTHVEDAELVAYPNVLQGIVEVGSSSEMYSTTVLLRRNAISGSQGRIDWLGGYRYFRLRESLSVHEDLTSIDTGGLVPLGTNFDVSDRFATENDFHGGEFGVTAEWYQGILSLELLAKVAVGNLHRQSHVDGQTTVTIPDAFQRVTPGGLLALPTNSGSYSDNQFAVLPEFGLTGTVLLTRRLSFVCGYSLLMLNKVARTGDQIDRLVNPTQIGGRPLQGPARPQFSFVSSDFWAQGVNLGLDYCW